MTCAYHATPIDGCVGCHGWDRALAEDQLQFMYGIEAATLRAALAEIDRLSAKPTTARDKLHAFLAAFDALAVNRADVATATDVDRVDHVVVLGVHTPAEVAALAAELDLPWPRHRENADGYRWVESADYRERGTTIVIQGGHRSRRDTAA